MKICKFLVVGLLTMSIQGKGVSQDIHGWKMKPLPISTRWAKEISPKTVLPEYPRPQMERKNDWSVLNGLWDYTITGSNDTVIPMAYTGKILVPYPLESALSGVKRTLKPNELLWYKCTFNYENNKSKRVLLHFGAVDWKATVYLNNVEIGFHLGGYTAFSFDITDKLKKGSNDLVIKVYDPTDRGVGPHGKQVLNPQNIYYTSSSGIWQTVWLEQVPGEYVSDIKLIPDIDKGILHVTTNTLGGDSVELIAKDGGKIVCVKKGKAGVVIDLPISNMKLWSPEIPFLYDLVIRIVKDDKIVDEVNSYFGMRKISVSKDKMGIDRIFLNNRPYFNLGTLDQGFWPEGLYTQPTDEAIKFDIGLIRAMGFNTIRKHIKIESSRWYYYADKLGMLVWQDFVNPNQGLPKGAREAFEEDCKETINQLYNNPCIVTWVIFNEKWGQYDQKRITDWVRSLDTSRLINGHSGELLYVNNNLRTPSLDPWIHSDMTDIHSYPFPRNAPQHDGKVRVLGEYGGIGVPVESHLWDDLEAGWGYDGIVTPMDLKRQYRQMIDSLKILKEDGLSASIYTQPFDVEYEQNGLSTYDREIIKIPIDTLRKINGDLLDDRNNALDHKFTSIKVVDENIESYKERVDNYNNGKRDSAFLRNFSLMAIQKRDDLIASKASNDYIRRLKDPFSEVNLRFIKRFTRNAKDIGFAFLNNNMSQANQILGENQVENLIRGIIGREEIVPYTKDTSSIPNWEEIERRVISKYGILGAEKVYGAEMVYYLNKREWEKFGKYYALYYKTAITRSEYHINNLSWPIFEHIRDSSILDVAIRASKYSIENFATNDPAEIDTYANLLYKAGKKEEAINWEQKAVNLSNSEEVFVETLEKMKNNVPTWN
ncbi:glycoside hydrolase family 2 protein [Chitinophaga sp. CF418]|uniref:glycoside hydrolase family 2 protein n=1 Tax=Chitinophaga sp. CF418 TaxID=1855287 RepID=UPI00090F0AC1|nr:sugar-binding domain-containing protein [Chitinophaga sp. CF418]SHN41850.1 Beta-galactosidase/beta-glucuronidase [Chitinophaga sp. CF418]